MDPTMVTRLKAAADIKLKLMAKYIPDLKAIEHTGEDGAPMQVTKIVLGDLSDDSPS